MDKCNGSISPNKHVTVNRLKVLFSGFVKALFEDSDLDLDL